MAPFLSMWGLCDVDADHGDGLVIVAFVIPTSGDKRQSRLDHSAGN